RADVRLRALRQPARATEALLAYLPFTDDETMRVEIGQGLKQLALRGGQPDPVLVKTLEDVLPLRRAVAAETLAAAGGPEYFPALRKLLKDPEAKVRLRVAVALTFARDKEAVPALIDLVAELPREQCWEAEDILFRLAGNQGPA